MDYLESNVIYSNDDASVHSSEPKREAVHCKENFWFDIVSSFIQQEASNKISKHQHTTCASRVIEHRALPNDPLKDNKQNNDSSVSTVLSTVSAFGMETVTLLQVEPCCSPANQIVSANQVAFPDDLSQPDKISHKCEEIFPETWDLSDQSRCAKEGVVSGNKESSEFQDPRQAVLEKDCHLSQWQKLLDKCEKPIDQECAASDIWDDDSFFSVKSGTYSRSSSPLTLDEHTDTESCIFEEALEDLSCNFLYNQKSNLHGLFTFMDTDQQAAFAPPYVEARSLSKGVRLKMNNNTEMTAKQHRNISCNTDISWLIDCCRDQEAQTEEMPRQEIGVNTDINFAELFPQGAINVGSGLQKGMKNCKENNCFSSTSHEALTERVVNAELKLLDVQRWMCWQLCWKTQQQCMEKQSLVNLQNVFAEHSQAVVGFNLLSALTEVGEKYLEMKRQIQSGVPLDTLVPLSMQLTKVKTPPDNLLNQCLTEICQLGIQKWSDGHSENLQRNQPPGNEKNLASTSLPSKTEDVQKEGREDFKPEQLSPHQNRCYVHVGNIAPSVKEVDLKTAFEKFEVSDIFLEESSLASSFAVLIFTCSEKAQSAVKEMDGKMFFGKKLKVRCIKDSSQNFKFAPQEIKMFSAALPEEKTKFCSGKIQSVNVQPQEDVSPSSKPIPHNEVKMGSYWENSKVSSNMPHNKASFLGANQTFKSAPTYNTSTIFDCRPPSPQWAWHPFHLNRVPYNSIPDPAYVNNYYPLYPFTSASPFSFQTSVNTPMCIPSVNMNSNARFHFKKDVGFGAPPTLRFSIQSNKMSSNSSTGLFNKATDAVTTQARDTAVQPVKEHASKSSENKHARSDFGGTTATSEVSSPLLINAATASKMPAVSDSLLSNENKKMDNSEKTSLQRAAPLRSPLFVPDSVTIPETSKTHSSVVSIDKDLLTQPSVTDQSGSLSSDDEESGVNPKHDHPVFIVPNRLNLGQFTKVMDHLLESHKSVSRDDVVFALEEIRIDRGGSLGGLTIPEILRQASSKVAAKFMPPS